MNEKLKNRSSYQGNRAQKAKTYRQKNSALA